MKRSPAAPSEATRALLQRLGEKWTLAVLGALAVGPHRYSELRREFKLTSKVLTRTLKGLEQSGFVMRLESPGMRRQVDYELTPVGRSLVELIRTFEESFPPETSIPRTRGRKHLQPAHGRVAPANAAIAPRPATKRSPRLDPEPVRQTADDVDLQLRFLTLAVHDVDRTARTFASVFGMAAPDFIDRPILVPPDQTALIRLCWFRFPSFSVGIAQPVAGPAPHRKFLDRFGEGIHHLGFSTTDNLQRAIARLRQQGGKWTVGGAGVTYAQLDFRDLLGAALGLSTAAHPRYRTHASGADVAAGPETLARHRVTNVGIVVRDIEEATRAYAELLGLGVSHIRTVDLALPGVSIVSHGSAKIAYLKQRGIALKLIEPQSPGPLQDFVDQHGNRAHHLGFDVGHDFPQAVARLEHHGGVVILGRRELGYTLIDLTKQLGIVLELSGTPARSG